MTDQQPFTEKLSGALRRDILPILKRLPAYGKLVYLLVKDPDISQRGKASLYLAIGYQVSPVDLIPGFIPVIGQLDDLLVLFWGIRRTLALLPSDRATQCLTDANLTQLQLEDDTALVQRALSSLVTTGARAVGRGAGAVLKYGVIAAAFVGYLAWYMMKKPAKNKNDQ